MTEHRIESNEDAAAEAGRGVRAARAVEPRGRLQAAQIIGIIDVAYR